MHDVNNGKIFGIGLPKSGTSTLHAALEILGYRSIHNPDDKVTTQQVRNADYRLKVIDQYDALMDNPIPGIFPQLDETWPGSKFILTLRSLEAWIASSRKAGFNQSYATPKPGSTVAFHRALLFGCNTFSESRFKWTYESHHLLVHHYFSGEKSHQLLVMDLEEGADWKELCDFLGKPIPDVPFPHKNKVKSRTQLSKFERTVVGGLVKAGVDYRLLRKVGNKVRPRDPE